MAERDSSLTHLDAHGNPGMVDVGAKTVTYREATAGARVVLGPEILRTLTEGDIQTKKGPVFRTAMIAGTMAVKQTSNLIPLCHPLPIEKIKLHIDVLDETQVRIHCTVGLHGKTGVEMEALTGASVAALTIYDMCKAMSHAIRIEDIQLLAKQGGKRDFDLR